MVGRHEETVLRVHEVDGVVLAVSEIGLRLQPMRFRPFLGGEQNRRRAVRQRRGVGRGQRAVRLVEGGLKLCDLLDTDVGPQIIVAEHARSRDNQIVEEPQIVGRRRALMAAESKLVLLRARDMPLLRHQFAMLAHGKAGARLGVGRRRHGEVAERKAADERGRLFGHRFFRADLCEPLGEGALQLDGRIGHGVGAGRNRHLDLPRRDFRRAAERRLQARAASLGQRNARRVLAELRADDGLARQIEILGVGDDGAAHHFVDVLALKAIFLDKGVQRRRHQVEIGEVVISGVAPAEGRADAAYNGHFAQSLHRNLPLIHSSSRKGAPAPYPGS